MDLRLRAARYDQLMNWELLVANWELLIAGASTVVAILALIVAVLSRRDSKDANRLADNANDIAGGARDAAERANELAGQANQFAEDANTISRRALAASEDNLIYQWRIDIEEDTGQARLVNYSAHDALEVSVVAVEDDRSVARGGAEMVPSFGEILLDISSTLEHHFEKVREHPSRPEAIADDFIYTGRVGKTVETDLVFHVTWKTVDNVRRDRQVEETLRHGDNFGTIERR